VSVVGLRRGKLVGWPAAGAPTAEGDGFFVLRGLLTCRVIVSGRESAELLGPGDVIYPRPPFAQPSVVSTTSWLVDVPTLLGVLDDRFHRSAARWPELTATLLERAVGRSESLLRRLAITEHPQITRRVYLLLWHLADRWGRDCDQGVLLPLTLSRVALARLVCSTRESVSRALSTLERYDLVRSRSPGYVLRCPSPGDFQRAPRL
jgi:CRP/FNR family transcriptional regulator, cyclic AMP receptor protein